MRTLVSSSLVDWYHFRFQECVRKSWRAVELAIQLDDLFAEVSAREVAWCAQYPMGDVEGERLQSPAMLAVAERLRDRFWLTTSLFFNAIGSRLDGDWPAAREYTDRGLSVASQDIRLLLTRARLEYEVGEVGHAEAYMERLREAIRLTPPGPTLEIAFSALLIPAIARTTGVADWLDIADGCAQTVLSSPSVTHGWAY